MPFYELIRKIQLLNQGYIVLVHVGTFFISVDLDAYILHELFGLKITKYSKKVNKVGIPENAIKKYVKQLEEYNVKFCIYENHDICHDIRALQTIYDNWYITFGNEDVVSKGKYTYARIYDNRKNRKRLFFDVCEDNNSNELNILDENKLKIVTNLMELEKSSRTIDELVNRENEKYILKCGIYYE